MIMDTARERKRIAANLARRRRERTEGVSVGGHSPDAAAPSRARPPVPGVYFGGQLVAVQDNHLRTHASLPGPGVVCSAARDDVGWYTLTWSYELVLVDCVDCLTEIARRAAEEVAA